MKACSSLDDPYFVRLVRLFNILGVVIVLSSVLGNPFGTLATIRYFAHSIDPVCGWSMPNTRRVGGFGTRMQGSAIIDPESASRGVRQKQLRNGVYILEYD